MKLIKPIIFLLSSLLIIACSTAPKPDPYTQHSTIFTVPKGLESHVGFWKKVYSQWDLHQFIAHDNQYIDVVYEIIELPPPIQEAQTSAQKALVKEQFSQIQQQLQVIETKFTHKIPLSAEDKRLIEPLIQHHGEASIIGMSERVRLQRGLKSRFAQGVVNSDLYLPYFKFIFKAYGLPEELALLPHVESSFQAHARSSVGASGMWQFMRRTAQDYLPMSTTVDGRLDPVIAAEGAARYLNDMHRSLPHWPFALTAYNHGIGGMHKAYQQCQTDFYCVVSQYRGERFGFASRNFYAEFLAALQVAQQSSQYFGSRPLQEAPQYTFIRLHQPWHAAKLAEQFNISIQELFDLNPAWITNANHGKYPLPAGLLVRLPKNTQQSIVQNHTHYEKVSFF